MVKTGMVAVGRITRLHGVHGEVCVRIESDNPDRFAPRSTFHTDLDHAPLLVLRGARYGPGGLIAEFAGFTSAEAAAPLVGADLMIREEDRRELAPGEFWPDQLISLEVCIGSDVIGVVEDVIQGPQDRLVVSCLAGDTAEIPFVEPLVPEINLEEGWLRIDPPDGLLTSRRAPAPRPGG